MDLAAAAKTMAAACTVSSSCCRCIFFLFPFAFRFDQSMDEGLLLYWIYGLCPGRICGSEAAFCWINQSMDQPLVLL